MSSSMETPVKLPAAMWVAVLLPSMLAAVLEVSRELGGPAAPVGAATLALLWLFTTLPMAAMAVGLRGLAARAGGGSPPEVQAALEAVARAEQVAARSAQAQAQLQALLLERSAPQDPGDKVPRGAARRSALLAAGLGAVFVLAAVGLAGVFAGPAAAPRAVHIHPAFAVFADGARVGYDDPAFDLTQRRVLRAHLHTGDGYPGVMHIEGGPGLTLAAFFRDGLGAELTEQRLVLDEVVHGGARYEENTTHRLRLFVQPAGGTWAEVKPIVGYVPRDHDRLLVSFGDERGAALEAQKAAVPSRFPP
jgi:hypothetical protein